MAAIPLTAAHRDDFVVLLILADTEDTVETLAQKVAAHTVGIRVMPKSAPLRVLWKGQVLPPEKRLCDCGLAPMDFVEVFYAENRAEN